MLDRLICLLFRVFVSAIFAFVFGTVLGGMCWIALVIIGIPLSLILPDITNSLFSERGVITLFKITFGFAFIAVFRES